MNLKTYDGKIEPVSFFKFVFVGHAIGVTTVFLPLFLLVSAMGAFVPMEDSNGDALPKWAALIIMPTMVPIIAAFQGLIVGGIVTLGLWVYTRRRKITLEAKS